MNTPNLTTIEENRMLYSIITDLDRKKFVGLAKEVERMKWVRLILRPCIDGFFRTLDRKPEIIREWCIEGGMTFRKFFIDEGYSRLPDWADVEKFEGYLKRNVFRYPPVFYISAAEKLVGYLERGKSQIEQ